MWLEKISFVRKSLNRNHYRHQLLHSLVFPEINITMKHHYETSLKFCFMTNKTNRYAKCSITVNAVALLWHKTQKQLKHTYKRYIYIYISFIW